jgi:hypothetical protein
MALPSRFAPLGLFLASALFAVATVVPALKGEPLNTTFLTLTIVFAILGGVVLRRSTSS